LLRRLAADASGLEGENRECEKQQKSGYGHGSSAQDTASSGRLRVQTRATLNGDEAGIGTQVV
jgi:hypothetical protein